MNEFQKDWAYHKYWVMGHSQIHYNELRALFRGNCWSKEKADRYREILQEAATISPTKATLTTSYQHMWGYFKKKASDEEREVYKRLIQQVCPEKDSLRPFMLELIARFQPSYLLVSKFFDEKGF